jgi:hypothetical protein
MWFWRGERWGHHIPEIVGANWFAANPEHTHHPVMESRKRNPVSVAFLEWIHLFGCESVSGAKTQLYIFSTSWLTQEKDFGLQDQSGVYNLKSQTYEHVLPRPRHFKLCPQKVWFIPNVWNTRDPFFQILLVTFTQLILNVGLRTCYNIVSDCIQFNIFFMAMHGFSFMLPLFACMSFYNVLQYWTI